MGKNDENGYIIDVNKLDQPIGEDEILELRATVCIECEMEISSYLDLEDLAAEYVPKRFAQRKDLKTCYIYLNSILSEESDWKIIGILESDEDEKFFEPPSSKESIKE